MKKKKSEKLIVKLKTQRDIKGEIFVKEFLLFYLTSTYIHEKFNS